MDVLSSKQVRGSCETRLKQNININERKDTRDDGVRSALVGGWLGLSLGEESGDVGLRATFSLDQTTARASLMSTYT
jgi:hypothetical protein